MTTQTQTQIGKVGETVDIRWKYKDQEFTGTGVVLRTEPYQEVMLHKSSESNGLRYKAGRTIILNPETDAILSVV